MAVSPAGVVSRKRDGRISPDPSTEQDRRRREGEGLREELTVYRLLTWHRGKRRSRTKKTKEEEEGVEEEEEEEEVEVEVEEATDEEEKEERANR